MLRKERAQGVAADCGGQQGEDGEEGEEEAEASEPGGMLRCWTSTMAAATSPAPHTGWSAVTLRTSSAPEGATL